MRHDGKVVDKFRYNGVKTVLELPVRLVKKTERKEQRNAPPGATESCEFVVYIPKGFGKEEEVRGTDIEVLRAVVWGKLDRHFDLEWETYYLITVSDPCFFGHRDGDAGVQLTVEEIDVGKLKWCRPCAVGIADGRQQVIPVYLEWTTSHTKVVVPFGQKRAIRREGYSRIRIEREIPPNWIPE